jgi:hypothetical protein
VWHVAAARSAFAAYGPEVPATLAPPRRVHVVGQPTAYAGAGLVVATAFAIGVAWSTERPPRDEAARRAYAECLAEGRGARACRPRRDAALTLCATRLPADDCEGELRELERAPALEPTASGPLAAPLHASLHRAVRFTAAALVLPAVVLASRGHDRRRVARVAAGCAVGVLVAAVPAFVALGLGALVSALVPASGLVLLGFGLFVGTFVAVLAAPALAGAADTGDARGRRVHASLAAAASGTALWILLVGPIPGARTAPLQGISTLALAVAGYLFRRAP